MKFEKQDRALVKGQGKLYATTIEKWMFPSVNVILIAFSRFGEFIYDAQKISIQAPSNSMEIKILPEQKNSYKFRPGEPISFQLKVLNKNDEKSSLHLLSVDERVRYFGRQNDISMDKFQEVVAQYYAKKELLPVKWSQGFRDNRYDDLAKFNAFIITNAYVKNKDCSLLPKSSGMKRQETDENILPGSNSESVSIERKYFPETFLFEDIQGSELEEYEYTLKTNAPHSITIFFVNGFVFHPIHGLGIASEKKFTVIKEFFTKAFLPHAIHVGEVLKLNLAAYNYHTSDLNAKIIVERGTIDGAKDQEDQSDFEFVKVAHSGGTCVIDKLNDKIQYKTIFVKINEGKSAFFFIRALSRGNLTLKITSIAEGRTDTMIRTIKVEPHGVLVRKNEGRFFDLRDMTNDAHSFKCIFPGDILHNTKKVFITAYGNILGQALSGTANLIRLPTGKFNQSKVAYKQSLLMFYLKFSSFDRLSRTDHG